MNQPLPELNVSYNQAELDGHLYRTSSAWDRIAYDSGECLIVELLEQQLETKVLN